MWSQALYPGHNYCHLGNVLLDKFTWKNDAETEGGGFLRRTSTGSARKTHMMLSVQLGWPQQFESAQSTRPSEREKTFRNF